MSRRECECPIPEDHGKFRPDYCRMCGGYIDPRWTSNDQTVRTFYTEVARLPGVTQEFLDQSFARELAGRDEFGHAFLDRHNEKEGREEGCDGGLYAHLRVLRARRERRPEHWELALQAAHLAAQLHSVFRQMDHLG